MIWMVAKKEFLEKILDFRVIVSFAVAGLVAVLVALVAGQDYQTRKASYDREVARCEAAYRDIRLFSQLSRELVFPPSPLSFLSHGRDLPTPITVMASRERVPAYIPGDFASNSFVRTFESLDLALVFRTLFALLVILLTFDSFTGERESGTLRAMLSTSISRLQIFSGKVLGIVGVVSTVTLLTYLLALTSIQWISGISFTGEQYACAFASYCLTIVYLTLFAFIGMVASLVVRQSATSLVLALLVWFVIAVIQPNFNTFLASELSSVPRLVEIGPELKQRVDQVWEEASRFRAENQSIEKSYKAYGVGTIGGLIYQVADAEYPFLEYTMKLVALQRKLIAATDEAWRSYEELYLRRLEYQASLNTLLDLLAPAAMYNQSVAFLSHTSIANYELFLEHARRYRSDCIQYLDRKGVFGSRAFLFFSRLREEDLTPEATARRMESYHRDPSAIPWIQRQPPLDLSDAPIFEEQQSRFAEDLIKTIPAFSMMLFYMILLALAGMRLLNQYDVR